MSGFPPITIDTMFIPYRQIGGIVAQVTIEEEHLDELEITQHPVEQGAAITDHSFKKPARLVVRVGWSRSGGPRFLGAQFGVYAQLLSLQASRQPFSVYTGRRVYGVPNPNMLISSIEVITDEKTAHALMATVRMQEVILVSTQTVDLSTATGLGTSGNQLMPQSTAQTVGLGDQVPKPTTNFNDGAAAGILGGPL